MAYIVGVDRNQIRMITTSLDDISLDLKDLGFTEYRGSNKGQSPYRRSDLLKLHIYGYLNKIRSSRALEIETKRNLELMWLINSITPDHGTIAGFVQKNKEAFHNTLRNLALVLKGWGLIAGKLIAIDGIKIRAQKKSEMSAVIADTGYYNGTEIKKCIDDGMNAFIKKAKANNRTKDNEFRKEKFFYDKDNDVYICPADNKLPFFENTSKNGIKYRRYKCSDCNSCEYKKACTSSASGRTIQRWEHEGILESVHQDTLRNNDVYKQRRCIVEHPFGTIKRTLGYSFFLRRQIDNVDAEAASMFIAYNFKRLLSMFSTRELLKKFG